MIHNSITLAGLSKIELKLEIPVEELRKLERSQPLGANHLPRRRAELVSVYFDTGS